MKRHLLGFLKDWLLSQPRKPLVLRGARQVGKTWLVRTLANEHNKKLIELNFEKNPHLQDYFSSNNPQQITLNLSSHLKQEIKPENSLLFLDEIQSAPDIFPKLRWFAEDLPELPVVAAGSLLEFLLADHTFSMPVGRIGYAHVEPLSFDEFLDNNNEQLFKYLCAYDFSYDIPQPIHQQLMTLFKEYILIGGMPEAAAHWISNHSLSKVNQIQNNLLGSFRDDFAKYKGRLELQRLEEVLIAIPEMLGQKFIFKNVNNEAQTETIKKSLSLLEKARLCTRVQNCHANGVPLGAEVDKKYFKEIFLDTGLSCTCLNLQLTDLNKVEELTLINRGSIAEQVTGQLLRSIDPPYIEPKLYCWHRIKEKSTAEMDYIIQYKGRVIPIEVKAGTTGSLKSLHFFMNLKKYKYAVRINSDYPSKTLVKVKDSGGATYELLSIPFYLIGQLPRLLDLMVI